MSAKLSGKALVIQLTRDHIRIAGIQLGANPQILCRTVCSTPEGAVEDGELRNISALANCIRRMIGPLEFSGFKRVIFALCTTKVLSEKVTAPAAGGKKLKRIIDTNLDIYFPVAVPDYQITDQVLSRGRNEYGRSITMQLRAVPKALLTPYYELASVCGLNVLAIDYFGNSHISISGGALSPEDFPAADNSPAKVYIMAEPELMLMTFLQDGRVRMQRSFLCGNDMESALSEALMVLDYYRSTANEKAAVSEAVLCGHLAETEAFRRSTATTLGIPVRTQANADPDWSICAGAARSALDLGCASLNGHREKRNMIGSALQYAVLIFGILLAVLALAVTAGSDFLRRAELSALQDTERSLQLQVEQSSEVAEAYLQTKTAYTNALSDWNSISHLVFTYNNNLGLVLDELEALMPVDSFTESIEIAPDGMALRFSCTDKETSAYLIAALRKMTYASVSAISGPEKASVSGHSDNHIHFSVTLDYNPELKRACSEYKSFDTNFLSEVDR